jgi:hypothetical protein
MITSNCRPCVRATRFHAIALLLCLNVVCVLVGSSHAAGIGWVRSGADLIIAGTGVTAYPCTLMVWPTSVAERRASSVAISYCGSGVVTFSNPTADTLTSSRIMEPTLLVSGFHDAEVSDTLFLPCEVSSDAVLNLTAVMLLGTECLSGSLDAQQSATVNGGAVSIPFPPHLLVCDEYPAADSVIVHLGGFGLSGVRGCLVGHESMPFRAEGDSSVKIVLSSEQRYRATAVRLVSAGGGGRCCRPAADRAFSQQVLGRIGGLFRRSLAPCRAWGI